MSEHIVEYDDIIHLFATLGFSGKSPPSPTGFQKAIQGEGGRQVQAMSAASADYYFQQLKDWCKTTITRDGEGVVRARYLKLFEVGVLEFFQEPRPPDDGLTTKTAMILMVWDGEEYRDHREIGKIIDDPFIIDGE